MNDAPPRPAAAALDATLDAMRAAQAHDPLPDWPLRARRLSTLERLILDQRDAIVVAIDADFGGRPAQETDLLEIFPSLSGLRHALRHGRRWMKPRRGFANLWFLPARTEILPQPRGVVGIIVPWNYPLYLAVGPLVDALAAGNRVMLKMSELTPQFSKLFARLIADAFGADEVAVVNGDADVGRAFAALPFDHLLFTGSTAVGRDVMAAAAKHLVPVTLELGGKSPAIVGRSARFDHAVERIVAGKLMNAGQTCIAPDYALVPRERVDAFVAKALDVIARFYPAETRASQYAAIINDRHFARLAALRDDAVAAGATAHRADGFDDGADVRRLAPTLLTRVDDASRVMQEEIFGPLLPIVPYETLDDAIAYVNARPHPLALYVFDEDAASVASVQRATQAGGVTVNDTILHIAQHALPFGGVGASGMGAYHGRAGFDAFSRLKPVLRQARWNAIGLFNPPYGARFRLFVRILLGR